MGGPGFESRNTFKPKCLQYYLLGCLTIIEIALILVLKYLSHRKSLKVLSDDGISYCILSMIGSYYFLECI